MDKFQQNKPEAAADRSQEIARQLLDAVGPSLSKWEVQQIIGVVKRETRFTEMETLFRQELDCEDLLRTGLSCLLAKGGKTNAAIFLPREGRSLHLTALVNASYPPESFDGFLKTLGEASCANIIELKEPALFSPIDFYHLIPIFGETAHKLRGQNVLVSPIPFSLHEESKKGALILFRELAYPKNSVELVEDFVKTFGPQLTRLTKVHHRKLDFRDLDYT